MKFEYALRRLLFYSSTEYDSTVVKLASCEQMLGARGIAVLLLDSSELLDLIPS